MTSRRTCMHAMGASQLCWLHTEPYSPGIRNVQRSALPFKGQGDVQQCGKEGRFRAARRCAHQDAVKLCGNKGQAGLVDGLGKGLVRDSEAPEAEHVGAEEARQRAAAVLDGKICPIGLQRT